MKKIDYTSFGEGGFTSGGDVFIKKWWACDKKERAQAVCAIVQMLAQYDSKRQTQYQISARLYGNSNLMGMNGLTYAKIASIQNTLKDRVSYNIVQSSIDTVTSKIAKNKPKPLFLTSGGDYKKQNKAKKLTKFIDGIFYENQAYALGVDLFKDACVFGDAFAYVYNLNGRVKFERVIPSELYVDWAESFYGEPRQMHRVKNIDRDVLKDLFPSHKKIIEEASSASADLEGSYQNVADQVAVVESWHLPSGPEASDGIHTINIPNGNLFEEKWEKDYFPFAHFQWSKRIYGYWGQGAAEQVQNIQLEVNKILWVIQRSYHLAGSFKILLENGSKIVKEHLTNDIGVIVNYTGTAPQYITPPIIPMEIYQHLQNLKNMAYEQLGVSQLSATSKKPEGLNSGKALREYNDIETDRFMTLGQAYEKFFLDVAKIAIDAAKDVYEDEGAYEVKVPGKKFIETIDWNDIDLEDDEYVMKCFPVSSLPDDPAGRLQTVQEYMQAGLIDPRQGKKLLNFPDLEQEESLDSAQEDYLSEILDKIVEDGEYTPPEPFDDLQLALKMSLEYYSKGKCSNLEPEKLEMLRQFNDQVNILMQKAMPPPQPQMGMGEPQAAPQAPPQSNLIPNVPGLTQ